MPEFVVLLALLSVAGAIIGYGAIQAEFNPREYL